MAEFVTLAPEKLSALREMNPCLMSYNIEFAEVTGGTFWKAYTPEQIAGTEPFQVGKGENITDMYKDLMQVYAPINLYDEKLRKLAKELGTAWVRVSGTWATKTYYDFDGTCNGKVPEGYLNVLTKDQWIGVLDFVKEIGAKLMISVANCPGLHSADQPWHPAEAEKIFALSKEYGVPIDGAEFANEPNMMEETGFPHGYTAADYRRDQDLFFVWLRKNYPDCLCIGPSSVGDGLDFMGSEDSASGGGVEQLTKENVSTEDLEEVVEFCINIGLPVTFEELGIKKLDEEKLMEAATLACAEGDTAHNMPFEVTPESVYNAMLAADRIGHYYKDYE